MKSEMTFKSSQLFLQLIISITCVAAVPRAPAPPPPPPSDVFFQALVCVVMEWPQSLSHRRSEVNCHSGSQEGGGGLAQSIAGVYKMAKRQYLCDNKESDSQHLRSITGLTVDAFGFDATYQAWRWKTAWREGEGRRFWLQLAAVTN